MWIFGVLVFWCGWRERRGLGKLRARFLVWVFGLFLGLVFFGRANSEFAFGHIYRRFASVEIEK